MEHFKMVPPHHHSSVAGAGQEGARKVCMQKIYPVAVLPLPKTLEQRRSRQFIRANMDSFAPGNHQSHSFLAPLRGFLPADPCAYCRAARAAELCQKPMWNQSGTDNLCFTHFFFNPFIIWCCVVRAKFFK